MFPKIQILGSKTLVSFICPCSGVTLVSSKIRRSPNAFNLVHQLEFLAKTGKSLEEVARTLQAPFRGNAFNPLMIFDLLVFPSLGLGFALWVLEFGM